MAIILEIITIIACILLILVVLVQDSKGGGLSSSFGASNQILGVRKTTDFLERATWILAISLLVLSLASAYFSNSAGTTTTNSSNSVTKSASDNMSLPQQAPGQNGGNTPPPAQK
jgi:preprotein translocase subunit SecG